MQPILIRLFILPLFCQGWLTSFSVPHSGGNLRHGSLLLARRRRPDTNKPGGDKGELGDGPNWLERSFPVPQEKIDSKTILDYSLGLSGASWETGALSLRMYQAITQRSSALQEAPPSMQNDIIETLKVYAMDFTAKEATKAALAQNGLEMVLQEEEEDEGMWGDVDSIRLLDDNGVPAGPLYDTWQEAVAHWTPGQGFDFVVRQVPAKMKELNLEELLGALDPDGKLREEGRAKNMNLIPESDEFQSLGEMTGENMRRVEDSPRATDAIFAGDPEKRGYQVITASELKECWKKAAAMSASEVEFMKSPTVLHVMESFVCHGCLIVDLEEHGFASLWNTVYNVFQKSLTEHFPPLSGASGTGSSHAKVGFVSYDNMQFLETRLSRATGHVLPEELKEEEAASLKDAFAVIAETAKTISKITIAASNLEALYNDVKFPDNFHIFQAAEQTVDELLDDGSELGTSSEAHPVSMSPHRLCRYHNGNAAGATEVFGAHTDSTFLTVVPVAAVPGLEVYDETAEKWYRPELAIPEKTEHSRYAVFMPGEFLQIFSRQEVLAAVHRVVVAAEKERFSAPVLLRGRPEAVIDTGRYFGHATTGLIEECRGKTMEEIHSSMQNSFQ